MVLRFRYGACGLSLSPDNGDWGLLARRREVKHPSDLSAAALTARRLLEALATHTQGQEKSASARQRRYSSTVHDTLIAAGLGVERDPNPGVEAVDMAFNLIS
jgi:hypothetical protein